MEPTDAPSGQSRTRRPRPLVAAALAASLLGAPGCHEWRPVSAYAQRPAEIEGQVLRFKENGTEHEMRVTSEDAPRITGVVKGDGGEPHTVTIDLRTVQDAEVRVVPRAGGEAPGSSPGGPPGSSPRGPQGSSGTPREVWIALGATFLAAVTAGTVIAVAASVKPMDFNRGLDFK